MEKNTQPLSLYIKMHSGYSLF